MKAKSLQELKQFRGALAERKALASVRQATAQLAEKRAAADQDLFQRAAGAVSPLRAAPRVRLQTDPPAAIAVQRQLDEQRVLLEAISDAFDSGTLLDTDDAMSFRRPGIGTDVTRKLRKGEWSIQRQLDLHGMRTDEAREALSAFIRDSHRQGLRCVRVIHGKGMGSPGKEPVLKGKVQGWLIQKNEVLAFVQAGPSHGGAGALVVLLRPVGA